jgi:AraC-like DNA-binding protein
MTHEGGVPRVGNLRHELGVSVDDPIVRNLLSSLLPAIAKPEEAHPLFLDHVALALTVHMAHTYGGMCANAELPRGGLAPWQERRVKELMSANLNHELPLSRLASECGLSVRHFARFPAIDRNLASPLAAEASSGLCAATTEQSGAISDVALSCGFADQSHFTRVFRAMVGVSPGAWRRANGLSHEDQES